MKVLPLLIGVVAAVPIAHPQMPGNKNNILCQHDHFYLFAANCKKGTPDSAIMSSLPSSSFGSLFSGFGGGGGGGGGGLSSLMSGMGGGGGLSSLMSGMGGGGGLSSLMSSFGMR